MAYTDPSGKIRRAARRNQAEMTTPRTGRELDDDEDEENEDEGEEGATGDGDDGYDDDEDDTGEPVPPRKRVRKSVPASYDDPADTEISAQRLFKGIGTIVENIVAPLRAEIMEQRAELEANRKSIRIMRKAVQDSTEAIDDIADTNEDLSKAIATIRGTEKMLKAFIETASENERITPQVHEGSASGKPADVLKKAITPAPGERMTPENALTPEQAGQAGALLRKAIEIQTSEQISVDGINPFGDALNQARITPELFEKFSKSVEEAEEIVKARRLQHA